MSDGGPFTHSKNSCEVAIEILQHTHTAVRNYIFHFSGALPTEEAVGTSKTKRLSAFVDRVSELAREFFQSRLRSLHITALDPRRAALRAETNRILGNLVAAKEDDLEVQSIITPILETLEATPRNSGCRYCRFICARTWNGMNLFAARR